MYYTNALKLLTKITLCGKLHCQKGFEFNLRVLNKVCSVIYESRLVPRRAIFSLCETSPEVVTKGSSTDVLNKENSTANQP
jgi:hypothetical protein